MWRLASFSGVAEPFVFIITLPDFFAVGLVALITAPDLLAEATATIRTDMARRSQVNLSTISSRIKENLK
jgi:hypothetical protein